MAAAGNFNMADPAVQEKVRRGHHVYIPTAGKHGTYVPCDGRNGNPKPYTHQEYPKMMCKDPRPQLKDFLKTKGGVDVLVTVAQDNLATALIEWDRKMTGSIVCNAEEEADYVRKNGKG